MEGSYRVTQVHRDRYQVKNGTEELYCVLTGSLRYREEYPVVGDYVEITVNPYGDSLIRSILPRRTAFYRPAADGFFPSGPGRPRGRICQEPAGSAAGGEH